MVLWDPHIIRQRIFHYPKLTHTLFYLCLLNHTVCPDRLFSNKLQAMDSLEKIVRMHPFADKWKAFGWSIVEID
mgnify:CR=1 FL=1